MVFWSVLDGSVRAVFRLSIHLKHAFPLQISIFLHYFLQNNNKNIELNSGDLFFAHFFLLFSLKQKRLRKIMHESKNKNRASAILLEHNLSKTRVPK